MRSVAIIVLAAASYVATATSFEPTFLPVAKEFVGDAFVRSLSDSGLALIEHLDRGQPSNFSVASSERIAFTIDRPGTGERRAFWGINNSGQTAGGQSVTNVPSSERSVVGSADGIQTFGDQPNGAFAINNQGVMAGAIYDGNDPKAAIISASGIVPLPVNARYSSAVDLNDHGLVLGWYFSAERRLNLPIMWDNGQPIDLNGDGNFVDATRINNAGQVAGLKATRIAGTDNWRLRPALWDKGTVTQIPGDHAQQFAESVDLSERGDLVYRVFDYDQSTATYSNYETHVWLNGVSSSLQSLIAPGFEEYEFGVTSINSSRWIGGAARHRVTGQTFPVILKPVPEPATLLGLTAGLALLIRRRRDPR